MLFSLILAWFAVLLALMTALKYIARVSGSGPLKRFFHNIHIPFGVLLLIVGGMHGLLAGNLPGTALADVQLAAALLPLNWGSACFLCAAALGGSYMLRRKLRRAWLPLHRSLTLILLLCLSLHIAGVGVQLPGQLFSGDSPRTKISAAPSPPALPVSSEAVASTAASSEKSVTDGASPVETSAGDSLSGSEPSVREDGAPPESILEPQTETPVVTFSGAQLADGIYEGSADGYHGGIVLSVTVSEGQVTDIAVASHNDTERFFQHAMDIIDTILSEQSLEVDAVTGATFSSAGIVNAVYDALENAVISGELSITEIDLPAVHRH